MALARECGEVGESQQTVNLSPFGLVGSNPTAPTKTTCKTNAPVAQLVRASDCDTNPK